VARLRTTSSASGATVPLPARAQKPRFPAVGACFVVLVPVGERRAVEIVQVGHFIGEKSVHCASSATRSMKRSGTHAAVFMSCVRRRSSPVFFRRSRKSPMSMVPRLQIGAHRTLRFPPWLTPPRYVRNFQKRHDTLRFPFVL